MKYTTDFLGRFNLDRELTPNLYEFLNLFCRSKRISRKIDNEIYGYEGEFYVDSDNDFGVDGEVKPPSTQPNLWCQWMPTYDRMGIESDGVINFQNYIEWLSYIINKILIPNKYNLTGKVNFQGQNSTDIGYLEVINNEIHVHKAGVPEYIHPIDMNIRLDFPFIDKIRSKRVKTNGKTKKELEAIIAEQAIQIANLKILLNERNN